ncbi:hypothetical protein L7F22_011778 [Adiantum nelumboides]|nr:hypothetical protein [Adiantum nelumboides]
MKEQLKYEDARFQKLNASYNTVKNTLTALLQNQEPTTAAPSTSDSAAANTLTALQDELQTKKLQRQLLVSGFMSQTAQHEAKVKQLEEELARAKAELEAVDSLTSTSHIHQAETHLPIQPPQMPEMPEFQGTEEEEQPRPAPGVLDIRKQMEHEIEDMPEGLAKVYLMYEKKVMESATLAFLQSEEQIKDFDSDFLPLPIMRHEANLWKEKMRPAVPRNEDGGYKGITLTSEQAKTIIEDHPRSWISQLVVTQSARTPRFQELHSRVTPSMTKEGSSEYYPPADEESAPLKQPPEQSGSHYYGTFQGNPSYPQPLPPGFPHPTQPEQQYRSGTVPGYPVLERTPEQHEGRLPCCGIGIGWFLQILDHASVLLEDLAPFGLAITLIGARHGLKPFKGLMICFDCELSTIEKMAIGRESYCSTAPMAMLLASMITSKGSSHEVIFRRWALNASF